MQNQLNNNGIINAKINGRYVYSLIWHLSLEHGKPATPCPYHLFIHVLATTSDSLPHALGHHELRLFVQCLAVMLHHAVFCIQQGRGNCFEGRGANVSRVQGRPCQKLKTPRIWATFFGRGQSSHAKNNKNKNEQHVSQMLGGLPSWGGGEAPPLPPPHGFSSLVLNVSNRLQCFLIVVRIENRPHYHGRVTCHLLPPSGCAIPYTRRDL